MSKELSKHADSLHKRPHFKRLTVVECAWPQSLKQIGGNALLYTVMHTEQKYTLTAIKKIADSDKNSISSISLRV